MDVQTLHEKKLRVQKNKSEKLNITNVTEEKRVCEGASRSILIWDSQDSQGFYLQGTANCKKVSNGIEWSLPR